MNIRNIFLIFFMMWGSSAFAITAGQFQLPFDKIGQNGQVWDPPCAEGNGYKSEPDQFHMMLNGGYHIGEDWNGVCGGNSDLNAPIYAIADGVVDFVDDINNSASGKWLSITHTLPDGTQVESRYLHLNEILVSVGSPVFKDTTIIARMGSTGNSNYSHLHWEIHTDLNAPVGGYPNPLTIDKALKYTSPSLFVDDRKNLVLEGLTWNSWNYFTVPENAPSSTAYIDYAGSKYSLLNASNNGIIWRYIYVYENGSWAYYPNITDVFFKKGLTYAVYSFTSFTSLNIFTPGNNYKKDRSIGDMIKFASQDSRFKNAKIETYGEDLNWHVDWEIRWLSFDYVSGSNSGTVYFNQITNKSNPLSRQVAFYDPDLGQWTNWIPLDWNTLQ